VEEREEIVTELLNRMWTVPTVSWVARNPDEPPSIDDLPAIQIFEMPDEAILKGFRSKFPEYARKLQVVLEFFINASARGAETQELHAFGKELKKKLYEGGANLGNRCVFVEKEASRVLRPPIEGHVVGIGLVLEIEYIEKVADLF